MGLYAILGSIRPTRMKPTATRRSFFSRTREACNSGFTLLEVMIGSIVMVLAISSSLIVLVHGMRAIDNARYTTLAGQILQSQMEKLRLLSWSQLKDITNGPFPRVASGTRNPDVFLSSSTIATDVDNKGPATSWFAPDIYITGVSTAQLSRFTVNGVGNRCLQKLELPSSIDGATTFDDSMRVITLTATWQGSDGRSHSLSYTTRYGQSGLSDFLYPVRN